MSKIGVSLKINVSQIEKARLFAGQKGHYLDATVFIDLDQLDQYGNSGMITQDVSKDEKAQGVKGPILGNCKVFWSENGQAPQAQGMQTNNLNQQPMNQNTPVSNGGFGQQQPSGQPAPQPQQGAGGFIEDDIPFMRFDY